MNRRDQDIEQLLDEYRRAGFSDEQSKLLATKIIDERRPWRVEVLAVALVTIIIAVGGWLKLGSVVDEIQDSRESITRSNCEDQNMRNATTLRQLDAVLDQAVQADPRSAEEVDRSRVSTAALINALVPVRDCDHVVAQVEVGN